MGIQLPQILQNLGQLILQKLTTIYSACLKEKQDYLLYYMTLYQHIVEDSFEGSLAFFILKRED